MKNREAIPKSQQLVFPHALSSVYGSSDHQIIRSPDHPITRFLDSSVSPCLGGRFSSAVGFPKRKKLVRRQRR